MQHFSIARQCRVDPFDPMNDAAVQIFYRMEFMFEQDINRFSATGTGFAINNCGNRLVKLYDVPFKLAERNQPCSLNMAYLVFKRFAHINECQRGNSVE